MPKVIDGLRVRRRREHGRNECAGYNFHTHGRGPAPGQGRARGAGSGSFVPRTRRKSNTSTRFYRRPLATLETPK